jgi:hypothetical protein
MAFVLRLSLDPTSVDRGVKSREITVDRMTPGNGMVRQEEPRVIGWGGDLDVSLDDCERWANTIPERRITEDAAIAVMALLIHELESVTVERVLDEGNGGDFLLSMKKGGEAVQIEVSGLREDADGGRSSSRLGEKLQQVLTKCDAGFASVTTFKRLKAGVVHSYLHFTDKPPRQGSKSPKKKGKVKRRKGK